MNGCQAGSAIVNGLPSVCAARIAVSGRQKVYTYLLSQVAMQPSMIAMLSSANARAL